MDQEEHDEQQVEQTDDQELFRGRDRTKVVETFQANTVKNAAKKLKISPATAAVWKNELGLTKAAPQKTASTPRKSGSFARSRKAGLNTGILREPRPAQFEQREQPSIPAYVPGTLDLELENKILKKLLIEAHVEVARTQER